MFSKKTTRQIALLLLIAALSLSSCNIGGGTAEATQDLNALSTAIVRAIHTDRASSSKQYIHIHQPAIATARHIRRGIGIPHHSDGGLL
jgi:predicted small secreted protein